MTSIEDGWCLTKGSIYIGGDWDHDNNGNTYDVMAVFYSWDQGTSWVKHIFNDLEGAVYDIAVHPIHTNVVFAGGGGYVPSLGQTVPHLLKTTNGGETWKEITAPEWNTGYNTVRCLAVDPSDTQRVWIGLDNGVYMSSDGGINWYHVNDKPDVSCLIVDPIHPTFVIFGTRYDGIEYTTNRGSSWRELGTDFPDDQSIRCMDIDLVNRYVYVGTGSGGVYRYNLGTTGVSDFSDPLFTETSALLPNYPNPFNAETRITYELKTAGLVNLWITDVQGRRVRTLLSGVQNAGKNEAFWDGKDDQGSDAASGIYIVRLRSSDGIKTMKMVLQK